MDFRASAALQNAVCVAPVAVLAAALPFTVTDPWKAAGAVAAVACWLNVSGKQRQHDPGGDG